MSRYRVILPVEIDGQGHGFGEVVELDLSTALEYSTALIAMEEGEEGHGGNGKSN
ncbi:MAG TPA: hypothetical protein VN442_18500 [Bryobacteraceae bacterium]|nr:hypothetical protein [Bryobacteraceae bacterium]